jgi:2-succinyl-5-enolpyruvyl-6-hydroxy-3-cyclohexene-1-carboxylate synthase
LFATPHGLDLQALAEAYGVPCEVVASDAADVARALGEAASAVVAGGASRLVLVRSDREANRLRREVVVAEVVADVERALE